MALADSQVPTNYSAGSSILMAGTAGATHGDVTLQTFSQHVQDYVSFISHPGQGAAHPGKL